MIFGIGSFYWILKSTELGMFIVPAALTLMRAGFLDRNPFPKLLFFPFIASLFVFLIVFLVDGNPNAAAVLASKLIVSSMILLHLTSGLVKDGPSILGGRLGLFMLLVSRAIIRERTMFRNVMYAFEVRRRASKPKRNRWEELMNKWSLSRGAILTTFSELLHLTDELDRLFNNRGGNLISKSWIVPTSRRIPVWLGDTFAFLIIILLVSFNQSFLLPKF